jgi:hypothetical protein
MVNACVKTGKALNEELGFASSADIMAGDNEGSNDERPKQPPRKAVMPYGVQPSKTNAITPAARRRARHYNESTFA